MKIMIIGGFLGSGKTTTILGISRQLRDEGKRVAIIVNEIGEIGLDGDILTDPDFVTEELTSGCICCTLRISMQYTLQTLEEEFKPDIVIIEPTGIAFPGQIRDEIETMGISELLFAPIVALADPFRFKTEMKEIPKFIETQIKEADIICINKIDITPAEIVLSTEEMLLEMNPDAEILKFSAKLGGEQFETLLFYLDISGPKKHPEEKKNSVELSKVSAFSTLYTLTSQDFNPEKGMQLVQESLQNIQDRIREINPAFVGHIKLSLKLPEFIVKGSVTSSKEAPQVEFIQNKKNDKTELRLLSAITKVPKNELAETVESTLEGQLRESGATFVKEPLEHGHEHKHNEHENGQATKINICGKNDLK